MQEGYKKGSLHPLTLIMNKAVTIFKEMGFAVEQGPELEDEWHNFDALNVQFAGEGVQQHPRLHRRKRIDILQVFQIAPQLPHSLLSPHPILPNKYNLVIFQNCYIAI